MQSVPIHQKCRALFRPVLCVWLSLVLALAPALRPRQARAVAVFDDVALALMVLSVLGYGVAAWQYSASQSDVDQLAQLLGSFPTEGVAAAVQDGFLYVGDLATSTVESIGTWFNGVQAQLSGVGLDSPEGTVVSGLTNTDGLTLTARNVYVSSNPVGLFSGDAVSMVQSHYGRIGDFLLCRVSLSSSENDWQFYFTDPEAVGESATYWTFPHGSSLSISNCLGVRIYTTADNLTIKSVSYVNARSGFFSGADSAHPSYVSPTLLQGSGFPVAGGLYSDIPGAVSPELDNLRTGTLAPVDWPTALADLGGVVVAPVPTETPTEVPSTEYPEWVWTPADDEALADWIERHKTGTTDPDPEDPEDPEQEETPVPIPWWWPWGEQTGPDVWQDIQDKVDDWTNPDFNPKPNPSPGTGTGDGIGGLPANPDAPTPDPNPDQPTGDKSWDDIGYDLSKVFPFCLPWDLLRVIGLIATDPVTPVLTWATPDPAGGNVTMTIDLHPWDSLASAVRKVEVVLFAAYLIVKTRDIMS